jgi:hypothetical protein
MIAPAGIHPDEFDESGVLIVKEHIARVVCGSH